MSGTAQVLAAIVTLALGSPLAASLGGRRATALASLAAATLGLGTALLAAASTLLGARDAGIGMRWAVPAGALALELDPLGAWFCLVVALVGLPVALYATSYLRDVLPRQRAAFALWLGLLLASLLLLAVARHALLFLAAWEAMTLCAFFLITSRHERDKVRRAGRLYLLANHTGSFCLLALIAALIAGAGSGDFHALRAAAASSSLPAGLVVALLLFGFGTKAGVVPLHIWLPHAHPAAPSPISALLSGIVVKAGIFGLLRFLPFLPPLEPWAGPLLLLIGAGSGVLGVLYALAQHELKRLLAYHTVENIGIILLGAGIGVIGARRGDPMVATLGFAGALLHVLNHAAFKALLFLGAGSVIRGAKTGEIDHLGGVARRMPLTATLFLVGCVAICGLPPCNGFASEWSIYRALLGEAAAGAGVPRLAGAGGTLALALIGGLAAACFAKAFAAVFLGTPRAPQADTLREASATELAAMGFLALLCMAIGLWPRAALALAWPAATQLAQALGAPAQPFEPVAAWLGSLARAGLVLVLGIGLLALVRRALGAAKGAPRVATWSCGFARPSARLQYTASSFAAPLLWVFHGALWTRTRARRAVGVFPRAPELETETDDRAESMLFRPLWAALLWICHPFRLLQRGPVQVQVLLVMVTLAVLLLWKVTLR